MGAYIKEAKDRHNRSLDSIWELEYCFNLKNAQKALIKPIAFKPIAAPHPGRYVPSPQQPVGPSVPSSSNILPNRLTPPSRAHDLKLALHSSSNHDDGYASQEYTSGSGSHSHSTSNTSSNTSSSFHNLSSHSGCAGDNSMNYSGEGGGEPSSGRGCNSKGVLLLDRTASYGSNGSSRHTSADHVTGYITQTPSPSDSGVGELETMLRDKDAEITHLRETMEHNETVIFQVYEEKRQNWSMQLKEVVGEWERRLRHHQQKSFKMEQALLLQLFKLQQERKNLRLEVEQLRSEKERSSTRVETLEAEQAALQRKLEEQQWETHQKAGEISLLKAQLKEAKEEASNKTNDLIGVRSQLKDVSGTQNESEQERCRLQDEVGRLNKELPALKAELEQLRRQVSRPKSDRLVQTDESRFTLTANMKAGSSPPPKPARAAATKAASSNSNSSNNSPTDSSSKPAASTSSSSSSSSDAIASIDSNNCSEELRLCRSELLAMRERYAVEKEQWLVEKNKVINYQKHLQLNYVQMFRKNKSLELEMEQLMVELENKDLTLSEQKGGAAGGAGATAAGSQPESTC